jgi:hypothetical protein
MILELINKLCGFFAEQGERFSDDEKKYAARAVAAIVAEQNTELVSKLLALLAEQKGPPPRQQRIALLAVAEIIEGESRAPGQ